METVLIANRGEIAIRIMNTCRALGLRTVAIYSDPDRGAPHCLAADSSIGIGGASTAESYLDINKVLDAARKSAADAIHPGYGFLSENPDFVDAVAAAGLVFIGPSAGAMRALGSKHQARNVAQSVNVPVIPGYQGEDQKRATLLREGEKIGFPLMIKASAGGGGRGMRLVSEKSQLSDSLDAAAREAKSFFGDDRLILERAIPSARHIEVQVIGDTFGNIVHLFERECSLQRRNQKVIEEAPAAILHSELRQKICNAAVTVARAGNLVSATTMEFLVPSNNPSDEFYFLEANCRIQVEHPVTELITGADLVELQIRVARGERLPFEQEDVTISGHAIEARVYAEAPSLNFAPKTGEVQRLILPPDEGQIRVDHALALGVKVSTNYDPMLAKVICWGADRAEALSALHTALSETVIFGVDNNIAFLRALLEHPSVRMGLLSTNFISEQLPTLTAQRPETARILAALWWMLQVQRFPLAHGPRFWRQRSCLHTFPAAKRDIAIRCSTASLTEKLSLQMKAMGEHGSIAIEIGMHLDQIQLIRFSPSERIPTVYFVWNEIPLHAVVNWEQASRYDDSPFEIVFDGHSFVLHSAPIHQEGLGLTAGDGDGAVIAPLPGTILAIKVSAGDRVDDGSLLASIESMKMEHAITAPYTGTVSEIFVTAGCTVKEGQRLFRVSPVP